MEPGAKITFFLFVFLCLFAKGFAGAVKAGEPQNTVKFTENKNQWDKNVLYRAQLDGGVLFLEKNCFTYNFYDKETLRKNHISEKKNGPPKKIEAIRSHAFRMTFAGADTAALVSSNNVTPDYCNFYIGQDKNKWAGGVKNYKEVNYKNLYTGIDLQVLGMQNSMKYNFIVSPQADPDAIQLSYVGLESIILMKNSLVLKTSLNEIEEQKPYAYQLIKGRKKEVKCLFVLKNETVSFIFPKGYDKNAALIIDPVLVFACSSGSTADNFGMTATYDSHGCLYAGGTCFDQGYPVTTGAYDGTYNGAVMGGRTDVIISKYDASGTFMQYSTYLGGASGTEIVSSLIVNSQNELMLFGATGSNDFPVTAGAYDATFNGGSYLSFPYNGTEYLSGTDLYVSKFNSTGTSLLASTYVGGSQNDGVNNSSTLVYNYGDYYRGEIQTDTLGNCYIASCTYSPDFPTTPGSTQPAAGGGMDGVVFKMNPGLTAMTWSTYLGGNADDGCYALTIDNLFNVYTTGGTSSTNFQTTPGAFSTSYNGGVTDGFITKIKNDGTAILKSTFVGTGSYDQSFLIQLDNNFDVYIIGQSEGTMPVSAGVYSNPNSKQFIWKMNSNLNTRLLTTIFGSGTGQVDISPSAFLVDVCGNIFVSGWGGNVITGVATMGMPVTSNAYQSSTDGFNFYLFVLAPNASSFLYGTYFGGPYSREHVDGGTSRFDKKGIVYQAVCAGCGGNDDFPVTPGSWPHTGSNVNHSFNCNEGVFKFDFQQSGVSAGVITLPNDTVCIGSPINFNNTSTNAFNYLWNFGDGSAINTAVSPSHIYAAAGSYTVTLIAIDSSGCVFSDTAHTRVVILPRPVVNLGPDVKFCSPPNVPLDAGTTGFIYTWSTGASTRTITASTTGTYWVKVGNGVCTGSDTISIQQVPKPNLGNDTTLCNGQNLVLHAPSGGVSYLWSTGDAASQSITVSAAGQYWVSVNWGTCTTSDTVSITVVPYPTVNLTPSVQFCPGDSIKLDPGNSANTTYLWSTGAVSQKITAVTAGIYYVKATSQACSIWDTTMVNGIPPHGWLNHVTVCNIEKYTLDAGFSGGTYQWSTGASTQQISITEPGPYWVKVNNHVCLYTDSVTIDGSFSGEVIWFPNSFTPNGDNLNDYFTAKGTDITDFQMLIFNRWGEQIFETKKIEEGWDGTCQGNPVEQDVYIWKIKYKTKCSKDLFAEKIGQVNVVR